MKHNISDTENSATYPVKQTELKELAAKFGSAKIRDLDLISRKLRFEMCRRIVIEKFGSFTEANSEIVSKFDKDVLIELLALAEFRTLGMTPVYQARSREYVARLQQEVVSMLSGYGIDNLEKVAATYTSFKDEDVLIFPDVGYTPHNLNALLKATSYTRQQCAEFLNVSLRSVQNWCTDLDSPGHTDMPAKKWAQLKQLLMSQPQHNDSKSPA